MEQKDWYLTRLKKIDKKYYSKGKSFYLLHYRVLSTAQRVLELLEGIDSDKVELALYMLVKDAEFQDFVRRYEYVLVMAKEKPDLFADQLYTFYAKMTSTIKNKKYMQRFFEFLSFFQNSDMETMDETTQKVYSAYMCLLLNQLEFLRNNKFDIFKAVAGLTTDGETIEVQDPFPSIDDISFEVFHQTQRGNLGFLYDYVRKVGLQKGYDLNDEDDLGILAATSEMYSNNLALLLPFINEYTVDIIPEEPFSPVFSDYLDDIPTAMQSSDTLKEALTHRKKTLPSNGMKVHFEDSKFTYDLLLKEVYYNGAIVCLFKLETDEGDLSGFYNTASKHFATVFNGVQTDASKIKAYLENTVLWAYASAVCDSEEILPTSQSYRTYLRDNRAEVFFTGIGGKLRVPSSARYALPKRNSEQYETETKYISGYIRKLPEGQKASERAVQIAESLGYDLAPDETYVQPFERASWVLRQGR